MPSQLPRIDMTGQIQCGNKRRIPTLRNCLKYFMQVFQSQATDRRDDQHNSLAPIPFLRVGEAADSVDLPRGNSDVAVKHLLSCIEI